jgi:NAD(P)-dependent dehydrogenase (short-subunit alcohol dehydrogenase family)
MYNPFSLEGKTILVTGASSGIGRATAIECSKMGARIILTGRNSARLKNTFEHLDGNSHQKIEADITNEEERNNLLNELPVLNGIVHSAGTSGHYLFSFLKKDDINRMFDINYFSSLYLTLSILKNKKLANGTSIVFITSTSGIISSYIGGSLYSSTKGALNGLIKGMALDLASKKIRVNSVMPSMVNTPIMEGGSIAKEQFDKDKERYPLKRYGEPEEIAYGVIYLLSDASLWITGTNLLIDGGISASY